MQFKKMSQKPDIIWPTNPTSEALWLVDTEKKQTKGRRCGNISFVVFKLDQEKHKWSLNIDQIFFCK